MSNAEYQSFDGREAPNGSADLLEGPLRLLVLVARDLRLLIGVPLIVAILTVAVSFLFANRYRSTVVILPPERTFQSMEMPWSEVSLLAGGGMALPLMATPSDILAAVISSRTVRDSLNSHLNLEQQWGMSELGVIARLKNNTGTDVDPSGMITAWAIDTDPHFADSLANRIVLEADHVNRAIVNTKARRTRQFVEKRLVETKSDMEKAMSRLEHFQNEHRTVALETQIQSLIQNAAQLQAQITSDEIELSVLEQTMSPEHARVKYLKSRITESRRRLESMRTAAPGDSSSTMFSAGLQNMPKLVQELAEITRDVKISENLYDLLTEQYENARIQEQRDTPSFSVLDYATSGGVKVSPQRALLGLTTFIVMLGLTLAVLLGREYLRQLHRTDPARYAAMHSAWMSLKRRK